jgi:hypothetical protein
MSESDKKKEKKKKRGAYKKKSDYDVIDDVALKNTSDQLKKPRINLKNLSPPKDLVNSNVTHPITLPTRKIDRLTGEPRKSNYVMTK